VTSGDSRPVPRPLRRKAQAREALAEFSESVHTGSIAAESAFGPAEGAHKRAEARRINLAHFAAHVLLLGLMLALLGSGLAYVALFPWLSGTVSTSWLQTTSSKGVFYIATGLAVLVAAALLATAVYFLSKLAAPRRERERFISALPWGLRLARPSLLAAAWLVLGAAFVAWCLGGT